MSKRGRSSSPQQTNKPSLSAGVRDGEGGGSGRHVLATSGQGDATELVHWLATHGCAGLDDLEFRSTASAGLGCFAKRDFEVGDTLFVIPHQCILTFNKAVASNSNQELLQRLQSKQTDDENSVITAELLVWLYMCEQYHDSGNSSCFGGYLRSLDRQRLPSVLCWPAEFQEALQGTNLHANLASIRPSMCAQLATVSGLLGTGSVSDVAEEDLLWARSHYLSRRYPAHFGEHTDVNEPGGVGNALLQSLPRESGLSKMGCLVPLLDILNHESGVEWLRFDVRDHALHVICNVARPKGCEFFSNYCSKSNEMFFYSYGFAVDENEDDMFNVRLMLRGSKGESGNASCLGNYYIQSGGIDGIPMVRIVVLNVWNCRS
jgi:hypothetical protein